MKKLFPFTLITSLLILLLASCSKKQTLPEKPALIQPQPVTENYFGKEITDPYRNIENLKDSNVVNWIKAEADYARAIIDDIPGRQELINKMVEFDARVSSKVSSLHITENDIYFYLKMTPQDETGKLYYRNGFEGDEIFLFDPTKYDTLSDKKYVISTLSSTDSGDKIIIGVAADGSEATDLLVLDVKNKTFLPDKLENLLFPIASWLPDGSGFLYNRGISADVHNVNRQINTKAHLHKMNEDFTKDKEIFSREKYPNLGIKPEDIPAVLYDKDSKYLYGMILSVDNRQFVYYAPVSELENDKINWKLLFDKDDEVYNFNATDKDLYIYTPKNAPNFQIIKTTLVNPNLQNAEVVIPEDKSKILTGFVLTSDALYYTMSQNGIQEKVYKRSNSNGVVTELELPFKAGTAYISNKGYKYSDFWINISGWSSNSKRYRYNNATNDFKMETLSDVAEYPEFENIVVEELMIPSHDGAMVPLSLIYNKDLKKDGNNPVFMWGYGAYGISMNPSFSPTQLLFTTKGGILAVAHVRGGGELGEAWHKGGFKTTKQNTWKDLIACAEYLNKENYTNPKKMAIWSGSAGGILIGRAITERPDLFAAAIPEVGSMNPLRMEQSPNGPVNVPEFGTVKDSVECMALIEMDSYLHLKKDEKYPAMLITAGMNDPRVIAWEPAKFAARMLEYNASDKPDLFLTDFSAGHGIGDTKTKQFESTADALSFSLWQTGHPEFQVK
ncbi:MAG: prolyl oligopeptidase family serine peptidase [Draconibacterium sp.]